MDASRPYASTLPEYMSLDAPRAKPIPCQTVVWTCAMIQGKPLWPFFWMDALLTIISGRDTCSIHRSVSMEFAVHRVSNSTWCHGWSSVQICFWSIGYEVIVAWAGLFAIDATGRWIYLVVVSNGVIGGTLKWEVGWYCQGKLHCGPSVTEWIALLSWGQRQSVGKTDGCCLSTATARTGVYCK